MEASGSFRWCRTGENVCLCGLLSGSVEVCVGRSRTERSRAVMPWELMQQQDRPEAFSEDQGLLGKGQSDFGRPSRGRKID